MIVKEKKGGQFFDLIKVKNIQNTILALAILYTIPGIIVLFSYLIKAITQ